MVKSKQGYKLYSREEIKSLVTDWYNTHGKIVIRDLRHKNNLPSVTQVTNEFGTFQDCLIECGIYVKTPTFDRVSYSDDELINMYRNFVDEHLSMNLYLPTNEDIDSNEDIPSSSTFVHRFGSFENLNSIIGYNQKDFNNSALEKDMIFKYMRACKEYGKTLSSREITELSKNNKEYIYCTMAYLNHFDSLHNLQEICDVVLTRPGTNTTRDVMIDKLKELGNVLGRTPVQKDLILYDFIPSCSAYIREFGSFKIALKESGYGKIRMLKTKNGIRCNSTYELKLAQFFESYNIPYKSEIMYKDVIKGFDRKYRFDFLININEKDIYIELFGIEGNENYDKRKSEKIELCKEHNIPLLSIYQSDIYSKTNKEIYEMLIERMKLQKVA